MAIGVAEPSTILPLVIHYFSESMIVVGLMISLFRGGQVIIQLYVAFHAQEYKRVLPYLKRVFFFRFLGWFLIGFSIYLIGDKSKTLTLIFIGLGLFLFSFMAGFGSIYFKELQAKLFTKKYRGKTMANRQVAGSIASIISGGFAGYFLNLYQPPLSYAYLFIFSSFIMAVGFFIFATIDEPSKEKIQKKEKRFHHFLRNALTILKNDKRLQLQIVAVFFSFSYLIAMPFVILNANKSITLTGWMVGGFITVKMIGSIVGSSLLWRRVSNYELMLLLGFIIMISSFVVAIFANNFYAYALIFLLMGIANDAFSIANMNLVIEIAPEEKRPIYTALQTNLSSFGLFFPILGGVLLKYIDSYLFIYLLTILFLLVGGVFSWKLLKNP